MTRITLGVDLGQRRDPSALAVAEIDRRPEAPGKTATHFLIRHLDRLPIGTPYPVVADRVAEVAEHATGRSDASLTVYVDATGLGQPVVDLVAERWDHGRILPVYFTHGDRRLDDGDSITLGKAYLVARLQTLLQSDRFHLPDSDEARRLADELASYEIEIREDANERYGAFRVGTRDDLVTALGLAVQTDSYPISGGGGLPFFP